MKLIITEVQSRVNLEFTLKVYCPPRLSAIVSRLIGLATVISPVVELTANDPLDSSWSVSIL